MNDLIRLAQTTVTVDWTGLDIPVDDILASAVSLTGQFMPLLILIGGASFGAYLFRNIRSIL